MTPANVHGTEVWAPADIERELHCHRSTALRWLQHPDFPQDVGTIAGTRVFIANDVRDWWTRTFSPEARLEQRRGVLKHYRLHGSIRAAARDAGVAFDTARGWLDAANLLDTPEDRMPA